MVLGFRWLEQVTIHRVGESLYLDVPDMYRNSVTMSRKITYLVIAPPRLAR